MPSNIRQRMLKDREKLVEMYHRRKLSLTDIAKIYGCSRQYAHLVFITLGISRRKRREALRISPKKRKSKFNFGPHHDSFIIGNYRDMTDGEMGRYLNKPATAVTYRRLIVLGKKKIERRDFSDKENTFILKNYRSLTDQVIAKVLDRSLISVTHHRSKVLNRPKKRNRAGTFEKNHASDGDIGGLSDAISLSALDQPSGLSFAEGIGLAGLTEPGDQEPRELSAPEELSGLN